jgi:hypothetical protein
MAMGAQTSETSFSVPGSSLTVQLGYDAKGQLTQLSSQGRRYFHRQPGGRKVFDDGFVTMSELVTRDQMLRQVSTGDKFWVETYRWDRNGRVTLVDGVRVERDARQRVIACIAPDAAWRYHYTGEFVAETERDGEARRVMRTSNGRPSSLKCGDRSYRIRYNDMGLRTDLPPLPDNYHRDLWGRLWTITGDDGRVLTTYLWDRYACLGRVDGPLGDPMSAVFSLDLTGTPVRLIQRNGVRRVPRDSYGEGLLEFEGSPGLYGGVAYRGNFYYASRVLDPVTASFNAPDPLDGRQDDPRRTGGYAGPLAVEHPGAGPYAVCQHDPVSRTDPTGAFSWWILLTDLTWASSTNMVGLLGLDFIFNFWGSVFTFWTGNLGRFFDREFFYSERAGTWGWRSDGVIGQITGGRAFAFQHQIWSPSHEFNVLDEVRVFAPQGEFRPTLYGTILRGTPKSGDPFLLQGDATLIPTPAAPGAQRPLNWTRAGGKAEPVVPGSMVPHFPAGGLHFDQKITALRGPLECTMAEIEPSGGLASGTVENRIIIDLASVERDVRAGLEVLFSDATPNVYITTIAAAVIEGSRTRIYISENIAALGPSGVRLRGLSPPSPSENVSHGAGTPNQYLDATGTTQPYASNDVLRLSQGGSVVGSALIDHLEAQLQIDAPLAGLAVPLDLFTAQPLGVASAATLDADPNFLISAAGPPNAGDALVISNSAGASLAVMVLEVTGNQWRVDRPAAPVLGAAGDAVNWQRLTVNLVELGTRADPLEAGAALTYRPAATRTAPANNFVAVRDSGGRPAVRAVTGLAYDAIVLGSALPGNTGSPYRVERLITRAPNLQNLTVTRGQTLVLDPPLPNDAVSLQLHQLNTATAVPGTAVTDSAVAGTTTFTVTGGKAELAISAGGSLTSANIVRPSGILGLSSGPTVTPVLVSRVRLGVTLDRALPLAEADLEAVRLDQSGLVYDAIPRALPVGSGAVALATVVPTTALPAANTRVQMPRFQPGEIVEVDYGGGSLRRNRIGVPAGDAAEPVEGTTLTLMDDAPPPAPLPATAGVVRLEPIAPNPRNGSSRIGVRGSATIAAGATATDQAVFEVWAGDGLPTGETLGLVSGNQTYPARVASIDRIEFDFVPLSAVADGLYEVVEIIDPAVAISTTAPSVTRDGGAIIIAQQPLAVGDNLVLAIPFKNSARSAAGELSGGTVIVPDDDEDGELTRLDALKAHELTHTRQWEMFGPLMLFGFPTWILEGFVEQFTDIEMPPFSPYVSGTITDNAGIRTLQIAASDTDFSQGEQVELSWAAQQPGPAGPVNVGGAGIGHLVKLGGENPADSNNFSITAGLNLVPRGLVNVQVRRKQGSNPWEVTLDVAQLLSAGGLMNFIGGAVYGGLFSLIGRGMYALVRAIGGQGKTFPAAVEGVDAEAGRILRVTDAEGRSALEGASRVIIEQDSTSLVRSVERIDTEILRLTEAVSLTGQVRVAPYATHRPDSTFDWNNYYPATIPDTSRPASIRVEPVGDDTLSLDPFDRLNILRGAQSFGRTVTAVAGDQVELNEPVPGSEAVFRVAKVGETDPIGNFDSALMSNELGMDWLRWVFDPYSQLQYDLQPDPSSFGGVLARLGRYFFGASSWSFIWFSVLTIDRVHQKEYMARIEQAASSNSGDTYSPLGRLRGKNAVVGDIARYWNVPLGGFRETDSFIPGGQQDAPGVWQIDRPRVMTSLAPVAGSTALNADVATDPAVTDPGNDLPDVFFAKDPTDPTAATAASPPGFTPATRGWIPTSPHLQRSNGLYAAFTRPGLHRITVVDRVDNFTDAAGNLVDTARQAREAQDGGRQTLWYDQNVTPVAVTINGQTVDDGDTITLVQTQRAAVSVTPNGARRYAVTVPRPRTGAGLRIPDPLLIEAQQANVTEHAEVSRLYRFDPVNQQYDDPVLQKHGIHLPTDIHIPLRRFAIEVIDTLPVRNALSLEPAANITELGPTQEAFILVPTAIGPQGLQIASATTGGAPVPLAQLAGLIQPPPAELGDATVFVRDGGVFRLVYDPALAPLGEVNLGLTVEVGPAPPYVLLNVALTLKP